jgi:hypothetical protein
MKYNKVSVSKLSCDSLVNHYNKCTNKLIHKMKTKNSYNKAEIKCLEYFSHSYLKCEKGHSQK